MKRIIILPILFSVIILASSCDHARGVDANTSQLVSSGNWKVSLFTDSGNDETQDFAGYTFTFSTGGTVMATKNGLTTNGTWAVNSSSTRFSINLGPKTTANKPLGELTDDWKIVSNSETEIRLADDNTASSEFLTFTKF